MDPLSFSRLLEIGGPWVNDGIRAAIKASVWPEEIEKLSLNYLEGGKKIRPLLALHAYMHATSSGARPDIEVLKAVASLELVHAYSLIHDDLPCMDNDDFRRGMPTLHRLVGEGRAVLVGDALLTLAFENLASLLFGETVRLKLLKCLAKAAGGAGMVGGQWGDVTAAKSGTFSHLKEKELLDIHAKKTGCLLGASLAFGYLLAQEKNGCLKPQLEDQLFEAGVTLGVLFQVVDDLLESQEQAAGEASVLHVFSKPKLETLKTDLKNRVNLQLEPLWNSETRSELLDYFIKRKV